MSSTKFNCPLPLQMELICSIMGKKKVLKSQLPAWSDHTIPITGHQTLLIQATNFL
jgi:hypothetical protein